MSATAVFEERLHVPLPSLPEQHRIADILSTVDEQIQRTDEIIEETEALKRGLMQGLLTTGPGDNVGTTEARIGPMPVEIADNWEVDYFDDVIELNPNDDVPNEDSFPFLPMDAVNEDTRTVDYWEERDAEDCTRPRFRNYVLVHEFVHAKHPQHSDRFWNAVGTVLPDYSDRRRWLRVNGNTLTV
ncbi:hypothetical protein J2754_002992 [Halarchaeum solikamskense]|uniref:YgjP-like metallopeptidase domain-containing protein n=1 Tax=Halarchaeum nitratireducens TaxID=489913 RepID=UPI00315B0F7F|nr:hypothetical protein [Halarchaeum solikamskense]